MSVLYVASDQQGAGKTAFCVTFAQKLSKMGKKALVLKPVSESSAAHESDPDVGIYQKLLGQKTDSSIQLRLNGGIEEGQIAKIKSVVEKASHDYDAVVIEGASGLSVQNHRRIAGAFDARTVVIARYQRDLSPSGLKPWKDALGGTLVGFVVNGVTRYLGMESRTNLVPAIESAGLVNLGLIPECRILLSSSVGQIANHLNGRFLIDDEYKDRLVQHYMAWGFSLDPGELTFSIRENKAVVVRGDRPDIQMSALATPTACLISTQGIEPIEYVRYEAEEEKVALMVVNENTLTTMESLGALMEQARFDHPEKLNAYSNLLDEHLHYPEILDSLGL